MKRKILFLFFMVALVQSCIIYPYEPCRPPYPPNQPYPGGNPWWYTDSEDNNTPDSNDDPNGSNNNSQTDSVKNAPNDVPSNNSNGGNVKNDFTPSHRYDSTTIDGILTFNVYLGWNVEQKETLVILRDFSEFGGEIIFNIYTNNHYMSMYGFSKYDTDFYVFSNNPPYCGYSSYSLETMGICQYKMIIKENRTHTERHCSGYWACNDGSNFYTAFKVLLYQRF